MINLFSENNDDIMFVTTAGNYANKHYQGLFVPQTSNHLRHDFLTGSYPSLRTDPTRPYLYLNATPGTNIRVILQWDDPWNHPINDYNLYLRDASDDIEITISENIQNGGDNQTPYEEISGDVNLTTQMYIDVVKANPSVQDKTLKLFLKITEDILQYNLIPNDSVLGHARASGEISVAAANWISPYSIEPFSSRGPNTIRYPANEIRNKPDITGVDRVSVSGAGGFPQIFGGTCAAAPHIAGIAALLWSKDPSKTADQIKTAIFNTADPRGDQNSFGHGLANATRAYYALYPALNITNITPSTGQNTGSIAITNLTGEGFQSGATVTLTHTGQPDIIATNVQVLSSSQITCTLPLTGKAAGQWNVTVTNPGGNKGVLPNGFTITAPNPGNTPFVIDPSKRNTPEGSYSTVKGYGWVDGGGSNNSYFKITLSGLDQNYPAEFHLKDDFTSQAMYGILVRGSYVTISGVDLSTAPNADLRPVHTITHTYNPMLMSDSGAGPIVVNNKVHDVKLVNVRGVSDNFPGVFVDSSDVSIIGTNNPDPYLTTYTGAGLNSSWGSNLTSYSTSSYGMGLMQQTNTRSSWVSVTGNGGAGVNITGPLSGVELNGKTAMLTGAGSGIHINGTGTESGTGSYRNSGITEWSGSQVTIIATDSSINGQEYGGYSQGGAKFAIICPSCSVDQIQQIRKMRALSDSSQGTGTSVTGGIHGIYLTGATGLPGAGNVTIGNVSIRGITGNGIAFNQASGYTVNLSSPTGVSGGLGKFGVTGNSSNVIHTTGSDIRVNTSEPYQVNITPDTIPGPDPFSLKIRNETGSVVYTITDWNNPPAGVTWNSTARIVSFDSPQLQIYSAEKVAAPASAPYGFVISTISLHYVTI